MEFACEQRELLGTIVEIKLPEKFACFFSDCFDEIKRIEQAYSRFLDSSQLSEINRSLNKWHKVSEEFFYLLEKSVEFYEKSDGNFDVTMKARLDALGYDKEHSFVPKDVKHQPSKLSKQSNISKPLSPILLDKANCKVFLAKEIEFGGLGKGFALDMVSKLLDRKNVPAYYINAGGDIFGRGKEWIILLEHPDNPEIAIGKISLNNKAIAASSGNRRNWKGLHHLINAKTGMPENSVKGIFVVAEKGIEADAFATALFTAGFENAIRLSEKLPADVMIISMENKMFISKGFDAELFG